MTAGGARQALLEDPDLAKEIRMTDGSSFVVGNREPWLAAAHAPIVLDRDGYARHPAYANITLIRFVRPNGKKAKKK